MIYLEPLIFSPSSLLLIYRSLGNLDFTIEKVAFRKSEMAILGSIHAPPYGFSYGQNVFHECIVEQHRRRNRLKPERVDQHR